LGKCIAGSGLELLLERAAAIPYYLLPLAAKASALYGLGRKVIVGVLENKISVPQNLSQGQTFEQSRPGIGACGAVWHLLSACLG
jgi:hypothetical protein